MDITGQPSRPGVPWDYSQQQQNKTKTRIRIKTQMDFAVHKYEAVALK